VKQKNNYRALKEIQNGIAILSYQNQEELLEDVHDEHTLIAFLTPFLASISDELQLDVVNSEHFQWLRQSDVLSTRLKPDGFFTVKGLFVKKEPPQDSASTFRNDKYCFGVPFLDLEDSIILFEGKRNITERALGEVVQYLQFLKGARNAVLFDETKFWLISCAPYIRDNQVNEILYCDWTLPGSATYFLEFLKKSMSIWANLIIEATKTLGLVIKEEGYLGKGAIGRVFNCLHKEKEVALKIVSGDQNSQLLIREFEAYCRLKDKGITCVASAVIEPVTLMNQKGSALCVAPVGKPMSRFARPFGKNLVRKAFTALEELHMNGVCHGDARVENLIFVDRKAIWIDLIDVVCLPLRILSDWHTLIRSILRLQNDEILEEKFRISIDEYLKFKDMNAFIDSIIIPV
jgi:tRNA A-37 threonylcarbamoyl transferase component Bud32